MPGISLNDPSERYYGIGFNPALPQFLLGATLSGKLLLMELAEDFSALSHLSTTTIGITVQLTGQLSWHPEGRLLLCAGASYFIVLEFLAEQQTFTEKSYLETNYAPGGGLFVSERIFMTHRADSSTDLVYLYELDLDSATLTFNSTHQISSTPLPILSLSKLNRSNVIITAYADSTDTFLQIFRTEDP